MDFKIDFIEFLEKYGRLPIASIREALDELEIMKEKVRKAESLAALEKDKANKAEMKLKELNYQYN